MTHADLARELIDIASGILKYQPQETLSAEVPYDSSWLDDICGLLHDNQAKCLEGISEEGEP